MSAEDEQHPVPQTLDAFQKIFESITDLAIIGEISETEDAKLAEIVDQIQALHDQFAERVMLDALKANGLGDGEDAQSLKKKIQTRLVMQADVNRGSDLSEIAAQALLETLDDSDIT